MASIPVAQAVATLGVVVVADVDHVADLKKQRRHSLTGHVSPRKRRGHRPYYYRTL
jgi:hypothetical protein